ncbi:putative serine-protein kinase ATM [Apostichopus japonicus]|uniref:Putative serine-protein kinase ATM n=1 Tax=Stichopus japonicus TaxID=307972 RepID=A0A2G8JKH9_STIJA|nr:putative serine-protein kinase ATM [Apostichopus japonicus]
MSESLTKLRTCCGQLASDKVTERKKQIDVFKKELGRPAVCRQLDENSKKGGGMTWEHCFEAVREFMVKEVAHVKSKLGKGKGNQDHRKLLSTTNIFKWFVQKANNTGEHLKLAKLVDHVILLIKDETSVLCYGTECCMVVSREVLGSWYYSCRLITKNWQDFLKYFCLILRDPPPGISLDLSTQLVHQLFAGAVQHSNIKKGIFFNFFKQIIEKCRSSEFSSTMVNTILGAMNTFCLYAAGDCREQVCRLGEETILTLLHIWKAQHSTTKAALVDFMYLQMRVHHPKGALTEAEGARAVNMEQWKSLVHKIYEVLYLEWTQASNKLKLKGLGAKEIKFSSSLVDLAADVCHQVFTGSSQELFTPDGFEPSSQSSTPKRKNVAGTTPVKRRKLESGWKMLRDHMTQAGQSPSIIPWLQLAEALIRRYPEALPKDQIAEFLAIFIQLQSECKRGEIHSQILLCLEALALCQATQTPPSTPGHHHPTGSQWTKVWAGTIRTIGLRTTEMEVFSLLTTLLVRKLVCPGQEVWKLFTSSIIHPTQYSLSFLSTLLRNTFLPEKHSNELRPNCESDYPLREDLLEWLLSSMEASDITENMKPVTNTGKNISSTLFSTVLCSLICKSPKAVLVHDYSSVLPSDDISPLSQVENLYLCSSFDEGDVGNHKGIPEDSPSSRELTPTVLLDMLQHLMKKLTEACRSHQQLDFSEVSSIQSAIQFSSVILKVLTILIARDISSLEDAPVAQIMRSLRSLLNLITESIKTSLSNLDEANKDELLQSFHPPVKNLVETFTWPSSDGSILSKKERKTFCHVIRCSISTELLDLLMMFVINKGIKKRGQPSAFTSSRHGDVIRDDFDDEFDTAASMRSKTDSEEDEFAVHQSSMSMNQDGDREYASKHTTLSVTDQFCLTSCYVLAHCCSSLSNEYSSPGGNHGIDQHELLKKLLQSFQEEFVAARPFESSPGDMKMWRTVK